MRSAWVSLVVLLAVATGCHDSPTEPTAMPTPAPTATPTPVPTPVTPPITLAAVYPCPAAGTVPRSLVMNVCSCVGEPIFVRFDQGAAVRIDCAETVTFGGSSTVLVTLSTSRWTLSQSLTLPDPNCGIRAVATCR